MAIASCEKIKKKEEFVTLNASLQCSQLFFRFQSILKTGNEITRFSCMTDTEVPTILSGDIAGIYHIHDPFKRKF